MIGALLDRLRDRKRRLIWNDTQASGRKGEDLAHRFLKSQGFIIAARNFRMSSGEGEADLIAWEADELAIVAVITRAREDYGPPERAIDPEKQRHLTRVARAFARKSGTPWERVRCDVVTVVLSEPPRIELFRRAVRLT
jgi:putative endonuclease